MSVALDQVDLSAATVGTTGAVDWTGVIQAGAPGGVRAGRPHLRVFNESGCGLRIVFTSGTSDRVPAGGWAVYELANDTRFTYVVEYILPGAPVTLVLCTIYEPGEAVPPAPVLGNSPIGIGGTVSTTTGNSLKNDGAAPGTSLVEATPSDQASSATQDYNDGSGFRKILSAGILRTIYNVIRGNATSGKAAIQFGDSGDPSITTLYGAVAGGQGGAFGFLSATAIHSDGTGGAVEMDANSTGDAMFIRSKTPATFWGSSGWSDGSGFQEGFYIFDQHTSSFLMIGGDGHGLSIARLDGGTATVRLNRSYLGTVDPATYATVNEGDEWIDL